MGGCSGGDATAAVIASPTTIVVIASLPPPSSLRRRRCPHHRRPRQIAVVVIAELLPLLKSSHGSCRFSRLPTVLPRSCGCGCRRCCRLRLVALTPPQRRRCQQLWAREARIGRQAVVAVAWLGVDVEACNHDRWEYIARGSVRDRETARTRDLSLGLL